MRGLKAIVAKADSGSITLELETGVRLQLDKSCGLRLGERVVVYYDMTTNQVKHFHRLDEQAEFKEEEVNIQEPTRSNVYCHIPSDEEIIPENTSVALPQVADWGFWTPESGFLDFWSSPPVD